MCFFKVWLTQDKGRNWQQFREVLASSELGVVFPKDSRVQINARKANADPYEYQATAVWKEGKAPPEYRSREWHEELQRVASCVRQRLPLVEPLTISSTREGVVQEFISYETGLVRLLDQDKGVVLFCLENVWVKEGGSNICLTEKDDRLLQDFIPIGSKVCVKKMSYVLLYFVTGAVHCETTGSSALQSDQISSGCCLDWLG